MPALTCIFTMSRTASRTFAASTAGSMISPRSRPDIMASSSAGRCRLPTGLVRMRSRLLFMSCPPSGEWRAMSARCQTCPCAGCWGSLPSTPFRPPRIRVRPPARAVAITTSMSLPPRAARLAFFVYQDPLWSIGDQLSATFDFDSDDALRAALGPLGLAFFADEKVLERSVRILDSFKVDADVFGHLVTLTVGPEDRYEHLGDADYDLAEALEARFFAAGLERYRIDPPRRDDWTFPAPPP